FSQRRVHARAVGRRDGGAARARSHRNDQADAEGRGKKAIALYSIHMASSRRTIALVVILLFVAVGISACGFVALGALFSTSVPPSIASNWTLYVKVQEPSREVELSHVFSAVMGRQSTLRTTIETIKKAKTDPHIKTLVFMP